MKCPNHWVTEATHYCATCGDFFCDKCVTGHEGQYYCARHYAPIKEKLEQEKRRKRNSRHCLIIHFQDGREDRGLCLVMNPQEKGFHYEIVDSDGHPTEEMRRALFSEVKRIDHVLRLDGRKHKHALTRDVDNEHPVVVVFKDHEVLRGRVRRPDAHKYERFYMHPAEDDGNTLTILIESAAVEQVYTPEEYERKLAEEKQKEKEALVQSGPVSQEESLGDLACQAHEYEEALAHYQKAAQEHGKTPRLRKKIIISNYNAGMQYVRHHRYPQALEFMQKVLEDDPDNEYAKQKAHKLQKRIDKTLKLMEQYTRQSGSGSGP